ncbi:MAG: tyrosine-type recombinase/integrase [Phycisphaerales bacterium]
MPCAARRANGRFASDRAELPALVPLVTTGEIARQLGGLSAGRIRLERLTHRTVGDLARAWLLSCRSYYVKRDQPTAMYFISERAVHYLRLARLQAIPPNEFEPGDLRELQRFLCLLKGQPLCRGTIKKYLRAIVEMFRWGVEMGAVDESVWRSLQAVRMLRKGRAPEPGVPVPREGRKRRPPIKGAVQRALPFMPAPVRAMVELEMLSACRPLEICGMRAGDLRPTDDPGVTAYAVRDDFNKVEGYGIARTVYLGPKALVVLAPWLEGLEPDDFVFSPKRAERARRTAAKATRTNPRWRSHSLTARRLSRGSKPAGWGDHYTTASYRRAVERACIAAGLPAGARWTPGQLRHGGATYFANKEDLLIAKEVLGHTDIRTTIGYVVADQPQVIAAVSRHG